MSSTYNQTTIKDYKGLFVKVTFNLSSLTGTIRGIHQKFIIFDVNNTGFEIKILYSSIETIKKGLAKKKKHKTKKKK